MTGPREDISLTCHSLQTLEVATARVYNWDVGQRRKRKSDGQESREKEGVDEPNG